MENTRTSSKLTSNKYVLIHIFYISKLYRASLLLFNTFKQFHLHVNVYDIYLKRTYIYVHNIRFTYTLVQQWKIRYVFDKILIEWNYLQFSAANFYILISNLESIINTYPACTYSWNHVNSTLNCDTNNN